MLSLRGWDGTGEADEPVVNWGAEDSEANGRDGGGNEDGRRREGQRAAQQ